MLQQMDSVTKPVNPGQYPYAPTCRSRDNGILGLAGPGGMENIAGLWREAYTIACRLIPLPTLAVALTTMY
jgi:hypothetical protein